MRGGDMMPRHAREKGTSGMYHILVIGVPDELLFKDNEDRYFFLELLYEKRVKYQFRLLGYCLLDDAYHLMLHEHKSQLATIMKSLNVSYAAYYHKKYGVAGALFKDRFKSECLSKMEEVLSCLVHVHFQPVEHHLTSYIERYEWSSYGDYIATGNSDLIAKEMILSLFALSTDDVKDTFVKRHQGDHGKFLQYEPVHKKPYASLVDARNYIKELLHIHAVDLENLHESANETIRIAIIRDLREKTALSINDLAHELCMKRSMIMHAIYHSKD
jgi:putative transposase